VNREKTLTAQLRADLRTSVTDPRDLENMIEMSESVPPSYPPSPGLDLGCVELDGVPAPATDQMVMVGDEVTPSIEGLTAVPSDAVDLPGVSESPELAVDRRQTHLLACLLQTGMEILGAAELPRPRQERRHGPFLAGHP